MQHSPSWEANQFSASKEIPRISRNPKVHYRVRKCPPPVSILSQINPVHTLVSPLLKIHFHIIFPSMSGSPKVQTDTDIDVDIFVNCNWVDTRWQ